MTLRGTTQPAAPAAVPLAPYRSAKPADNPELFVVAKRIIAFYDRAVGSTHLHKNGAEKLIEQLQRGRTEEQLCRAALGYAAHCQRQETLPKYREGVCSFYGTGSCDQFLDYQPPDSQADRRARDADILRQRREAQEKLQRSRQAHSTITIGDALPKPPGSKEGESCPKT